ncbi:MAG: hypothetical protein HY210_00140 [Candidatus Omnitrophica bacterium]|nr:hypothetical protein [Candidatus Omnitrophota bacterium]
MMRKQQVLIVLLVLLIFCPRPVAAHPPSDVKLSYDAPTAILHIEVAHVAKNLREDGIRQLVIYKNAQELSRITIIRQTTPNSLTKDFPLEAVAGDAIRVRAISKGGGYLDQTIVIPREEKEQPG